MRHVARRAAATVSCALPAAARIAMSSPAPIVNPEQFPERRSELALRGPAGALECICDVPEAAAALPATMVICHPHPLHGGTMHNKVVTILERSMRELGLRTARFNFRGVGASAGVHDDGRGETEDLLAVSEWVRQVRPGDSLWLGGFSFGAWIALRAAQTLHLGQLVSVAPPVKRFGFEELARPDCPWLVIQGDQDEVVDVTAVRAWVDGLSPAPDFVVMENAGHYFHGRLMDLRGLLQDRVMAQLPARSSKPV